MVARIVYKRKAGWRTGKHVYYRGTMEQLEEHAEKNARGCEYRIQPLDEVPPHYEKYGAICDL